MQRQRGPRHHRAEEGEEGESRGCEKNRVRLEANNVVLLGIGTGHHHLMTVYQRLFSQLPPSGYECEPM